MTQRPLMTGLPFAAAAFALPTSAQAAPTSNVASSMASFAQEQAGKDAEERAAETRASYIARKQAGEASKCEDCSDCQPCEACKDCDQSTADQEKAGASRNA